MTLQNEKNDTRIDEKISEIRDIVQQELNAPVDYCTNGTRRREYKDARHILCYVLHKTFKHLPFTKLGWESGHRDHASAINSCNLVANMIDTEKDFRPTIDKILLRCKDVKGEGKVSLIDMALAVVYQFFNYGRYDFVETLDDVNYYVVCIDKYVWNTDSVINEVVQHFSTKGIEIKFKRNLTGPYYRILMFPEKIFE